MTTSEYLDALRARLELPSDYALAAYFNVTRSYVSKLRTQHAVMGEDMCFRVAEILGKKPAFVLLDMERARSTSDKTRRIWEEIQEGFQKPLLHANRAIGIPLTR